MVSKIKQVSVFLSSPGDLSAERKIVKEVCEEINLDRGHLDNFNVALLTWETHVSPRKGIRSQEVISQDIGSKYDIYLGLMGQRFGTPTGKWKSGTEEEFRDALARNIQTGQPELMFYFSDQQVNLSNIDVNQYKKVKLFQKSLKDNGVLYWSYGDIAGLKTFLHRHLSISISRLLVERAQNLSKVTVPSSAERLFDPLASWKVLMSTNAEISMVELLTESTKSLNEVNEYTNKIAKEVANLTRGMSTANQSLQIYSPEPIKNLPIILKMLKDLTKILDSYASRMIEILPKAHHAMSNCLTKLQRAINIGRDHRLLDTNSRARLADMLQALRQTSPAVIKSVSLLESTMSDWPKNFGGLENSRLRIVAVGKDLSRFFEYNMITIDGIVDDIADPLET